MSVNKLAYVHGQSRLAKYRIPLTIKGVTVDTSTTDLLDKNAEDDHCLQ